MSANGKIALVTGAGSGIGRAAALALHATGYAVVLAGRRAAPLDETAHLAQHADSPLLAVPTDIGKPASVQALFACTKDTFGRLDVLFNNAGIGAPDVPLEEVTYAQWSAVVAVNLTGAFLCAQEAIRLMKAQRPRGGRIINNGSLSAQTPRPHSAPYTATKHAITGLTKSIALDGRAHDIACGQIDIGNAATDMTERMAEGVLQASGATVVEPRASGATVVEPRASGATVVEPRMDVRHVAEAVVYMANLPLDATVLSMTVLATAMPFVGRG